MPENPALSQPPKKVFIQTFGCQMNEYDSAKMLEQLYGLGYTSAETAREADLVLVNTCAIREKAENKVYSLLGRLAGLKSARPGAIIGVGGCVAQQRGEAILKRVKHVDLVFGTDNLFELPELLAAAERGERLAQTAWHSRQERVQNFIPDFPQFPARTAPLNTPEQPGEVTAHLAITKGCNNFCTFCVVPYTRGREVSREPDNIVAEAERLVAGGVKEITLLGQNVNSYRAGGIKFVELLERINGLPGLERIRYTSPHPKDFHNELADAHVRLPKLCEHLHLPFQSGSNRILKAMRRNHRIESYFDKISMVKERVPNIALSTDIIVGFPGETEEDFEATLQVVRQLRFDHMYAFKYSQRSDTPASEFSGQVSEAEKSHRLDRLLALHEECLSESNSALVGTRQQVLLERPHPGEAGAMAGRSRGNKSVLVADSERKPGELLDVEIVAARRYSLIGRELIRGS